LVTLGTTLQKPSVPSSSTSSTKQSTNPTETEAFDTSDELLDNLVKNAALTTTKDVIRQRRIARYAQRQSCNFFRYKISFVILLF
jgi:hypothetical protein